MYRKLRSLSGQQKSKFPVKNISRYMISGKEALKRAFFLEREML